MKIPFSEFTITFVRSGGPGGQNVNKVNTKAQLHFKVGESRVLSIEQKARVRIKLANRLNKNDEIIVYADSERSQGQNKNKAIELLNALVANAIKLPKKRRATKPTKSSKEKRLTDKLRRARIKVSRSKALHDY